MIGRRFKDHSKLSALFIPGVRLPGVMPGDQPLRLRLELDQGAPVAGLPAEVVEPRAAPRL
jgi:hypothetical protein